jgi:hypothetical protein
MDFRRKDMVTEVTRGPNFDESDDYTNDKLNHEFETLLSELEPRYLREFFGCETKKRDLTCFNCLDQRTSWCDQDWEFAQKQKGGVKCVGCHHWYTDAGYKELADTYAKELEEQRQKWGPRPAPQS